MTSNPQILVLGAGLAGLAAARHIIERGRACVVLERCPTTGGLTRTVEIGDYCFDYTGHFLHLTKCRTPSDIPYAEQDDSDWFCVEKCSKALIAGALVPTPVQYNISALPPELKRRSIESYNARPTGQKEVRNLKEYLIRGFGEALSEIFLIPQNEKTQAIRLDKLSQNAVKRFFPAPNETDVRAGMVERPAQVQTYNSKFWYPKHGGISKLLTRMAGKIPTLLCNYEVSSIDFSKKVVVTSDGSVFHWDKIISTLPLRQFCSRVQDLEISDVARCLSNSSTVVFNIGFEGELPQVLDGLHWIYVPDREISFYRFGLYSNISRGTSAFGSHSAYVEVGLSFEDLANVNLPELQLRVLDDLEKVGWIERSAIRCIAVNIIPVAYVHFTRRREEVVPAVREKLRRSGILTVGRYGVWDYTSMEDNIIQTVKDTEAFLFE